LKTDATGMARMNLTDGASATLTEITNMSLQGAKLGSNLGFIPGREYPVPFNPQVNSASTLIP